MTIPSTITTKTQLRRVIRDAETAASILRSPGHRFHGTGERQRVADLLTSLANVARRAFGEPHGRRLPEGEDAV